MVQMRCGLLLAAGLIFTLLTGCGRETTQPDDFTFLDGNAGFMASEVATMDDALDSVFTGGLAKGLATEADTYHVDLTLVRWHYDSTINACVRESHAYYNEGERTRRDTAWFYGGGALLSNPTLALVDSVVHHRRTERTRAGNQVQINFRMTIRIEKTAGDTTAVRSGNVTGTYNGVQFRTCTVTNVTRHRVNGVWQFPESGSIYIDRPLRTIDIVFQGNGTAKATVYRKRNGRTVIVTINVDTGEESES